MIYFLRDHKCGFKLGKAISQQYISISNKMGSNQHIELLTFYDEHKDMIINNNEDKFVIFIRNPKEILVSGWKYHQVCKEPWCVKKNGYFYSDFLTNNISKKNIDLAKTFSIGETYQNKIKNSDNGILFEMKNVGNLTLSGMNNILDIKKENVFFLDVDLYTHRFNSTVIKFLDFLKFKKNNWYNHLKNVLGSKTNIKKRGENKPHITNKHFKKDRYKEYWNDKLEEELKNMFPKLMTKYKEVINETY